MSKIKRNLPYWNNETLRTAAIPYNTRSDFKLNEGAAYCYMTRHKELLDVDYICSHMKKVVRWTQETIQIETLKYTKRTDFKNKCGAAYHAAHRMNIMDEVCKHMSKGGGGFDPMKPAIFYFARIDNGIAYKFGITNRSFKLRYEKQDRDRMTVLYEIHFLNGQDAWDLEKEVSKKFSHLKYKGERILKGASINELLTCSVKLY